jgi:tetratricopeptide (TPR) repeat protein
MIARSTQEFERAGGMDHPFTIDSRREHGTLLSLLGRRAEAQALIAKSVADLERTKGVDDPELTANARIVLGQVLTLRGAFAEAEPQLAHALRVTVASNSNILATAARVMQARVFTAQGRFEDSARTLADIEKTSIAISGEGSLRHALALTRLGQFELARGNLGHAQQYFEKLYGWPEKADAMSNGRANAGVGLIRIDLARGNPAMALARARKLLAEIEASKERPTMLDPETDARMLLGVALLQSGDSAAALAFLQQAVANREQMDVPQSPWLAEARLSLAQGLMDQRKQAAAREQFDLAQRAYDANPKLAPPFKALLADTRRRLAAN